MSTSGKIGQYTPAELSAMLRTLAAKAQTADEEQAKALLPEAEQLLTKIGQELQVDQGALAAARNDVMAERAKIDAQYNQKDAAREATQAAHMNQLQQQLNMSQQNRSQQGLWTRLTTSDDQSQAIEAQMQNTAFQHDQEDMRDAQERHHAVAAAMQKAQPYEQEAAGTHSVYGEAQGFLQMLRNRATGWGPGSKVFTRVQRMVDYGLRAMNRDLDAKAAMALTAALNGRPIDELNDLQMQLRNLNQRVPHRYRVTDLEALAVLACACVAGKVPAEQVFDLWQMAIDHARRVGGFSSDEDARSMVVFCTAVTRLPVEQVQSDRRSINVDNFRGLDPEGAGLILLAHTLCGRNVHELVHVYHAAGSAGLPQEERAYMAMAAGLGNKDHSYVVGRFRSLAQMVTNMVPVPSSYELRRAAIREAAATLTIAGSVSNYNDQQLLELYNFTSDFRPAYGQEDFEARGALIIGAVHPDCKL